MMKPKKVFLDHDGGIDDLLSLLLLLNIPDVELLGVNVTPADCYLEPALESSYKLLHLLKQTEVPLGRGDLFGVNAFPNEWRARPEVVNALPMLINIPYEVDPYLLPSGTELLRKVLRESADPVTIMMTGPCSNLVRVIKDNPELKSGIEKVIWMGGAFRTQGNVQTYQHNGTAEWNVYWDPISSKELFEMGLPLLCVPLDVTNHVPVNKEFLSRLARQSEYEVSNLAGQLWAMTIDTIPSYHYVYFMWDVLATSFVAIGEEFTVERVTATVSDRPPNAGQTSIDPKGNAIDIAVDVNKERFYQFLLDAFKKGL